MNQLILLNGPNLNLLGDREPHLYGSVTLQEIETRLQHQAGQAGFGLQCIQSNHEGVLIDAIHAARKTTRGLIINPGGLTHTSVSLRDALAAYDAPIIELHLSNVYQRESFRHTSYVSPLAKGIIAGFGPLGYELALSALVSVISAEC